MKVVIAAVMYSPNLGDGLIAECLTRLIRDARPDANVTWLDLAGRQAFSQPTGGARTKVLDLLARSPDWLSQPVAGALVAHQVRSRLAPLVPSALEGADLLMIGGGQLLGDANLNFPLKIQHVVREAEARSIPIALHGVGVSAEWSARGRALFKDLLNSPMLRFVSVRDDRSAENLARHYVRLGINPPCDVAVFPDPGLCADLLEPVAHQSQPKVVRNVGIGIVHPAALATHGLAGRPSMQTMISAYQSLIDTLQDRGAQVTLFTNGAGEDEEFLGQLGTSGNLPTTVRIQPRCNTPVELVSFLRGMDAVASHRLHACIAANAVGTRAVGFRWDKKIDAYFALTGQEEFLFEAPSGDAALVDAVLKPIELEALDRLTCLKPAVRSGVASMLATG